MDHGDGIPRESPNLRDTDSKGIRFLSESDSLINPKLGLFVFQVTVPKREPCLQGECVPNSLSQSLRCVARLK